MDCKDLPEEEHDFYNYCSQITNPKTLNVRSTFTNIRRTLGLTTGEFTQILEALEEDGLLIPDHRKATIRLVSKDRFCRCFLTRTHARELTTSTTTEEPKPKDSSSVSSRVGDSPNRIKRRVRRKPPSAWSHFDLVQYMDKELSRHGFPGSVNRGAMAKTFSMWLDNGMAPEDIFQMIREFVKRRQRYLVGSKAPAWKVFLWRRDVIQTEIKVFSKPNYDPPGTFTPAGERKYRENK